MASIGSVMSTLIREKEGLDKVLLLEGSHDAGKLIADVIHSRTKSRIAFVLGGVNKGTRAGLENPKSVKFLFVKNLSEKIREVNNIDKVAILIRRNFCQKIQMPPSRRQALNSSSLQ